MKFELQYELTPQQIFFRGHRVLQLCCHNVEPAHVIKCNQKQLKRKFCWFRRFEIKKNRFGRSGVILLQSLILYFAIIYSRKLSCSKQSFVVKTIHLYMSRILQFFTQVFFSFSLIHGHVSQFEGQKSRGQFSENLVLWINKFLFNFGDRISKEKKFWNFWELKI